MDFGVHLPQLGRSATRDNLLEWATAADELDLHSAWVSDHVAWPRDIETNGWLIRMFQPGIMRNASPAVSSSEASFSVSSQTLIL